MKNKSYKMTILEACKELSKNPSYNGKFDDILILTGKRTKKDLVCGSLCHGYSNDLLDMCFEELIKRYVKYAEKENLSIDDIIIYVTQYLKEYKKLNRIITVGDILK